MGAWIEISLTNGTYPNYNVAPHVGAWIEIKEQGGTHPYECVAPHVGAWIEMFKPTINPKLAASHPTWVRGLKYGDERPVDAKLQSHPTWVRGLK